MTEEKKDAGVDVTPPAETTPQTEEVKAPAEESKESASAVGGTEEFNGGGQDVANPTPPAEPVKEDSAPASASSEEQADDDGWEEVQSEMGKSVRWNEVARNDKEAQNSVFIGNLVHGVYSEKRENVGENSATIYQIRTVEHGLLNVWSTTVLADRMKRVWEGNEIKIEYQGEQAPKGGGKPYSLFKVTQRPATPELLAQLDAKAQEQAPAQAPSEATKEKTDDETMEDPEFA